MKMIDHNHFICHLILGTFTEYPFSACCGPVCQFQLIPDSGNRIISALPVPGD